MSALLFGSISTIADTSELQRRAFNQAFARHGLDWHWDREQYRAMLGTSGGQNRIAEYARTRDQAVDAEAVHRTKSKIFQDSLSSAPVQPREGVLDTVRAARQAGTKVAFVTTTAPQNVTALLAALAPALSADDFDLVVDATTVGAAKPDRAAYDHALAALGEHAQDCVAIEDNLAGVQAANAAGVRCVAFPNANTATTHFPTAQTRVSALDPSQLQAMVAW